MAGKSSHDGKSPVKSVIVLGLLVCVLFGVALAFAWELRNLWVMLIAGAVIAVVAGVVARRLWEPGAFRALDREQRRAVRRAVRRGEAVDDPRLARPLVEVARAVLGAPYSPGLYRVLYGLPGALGLLVIVLSVPDDGWSSVAFQLPLVLLSLVMLFVLPPVVRRRRVRAARAAELTLARFPGLD
ncbi:hypothetical protein [Saccharothrix xinjiangensis]|uniref:Sensor histidine kinase n=1 Tax=Saccharothrix xinjiangensis TaxID=204798 RepID=A0ABV9Y2P5_9PSEU